MLIKIGDFARECRVTVKALHHYERMGLLKPAWINRYNGYRFYAPGQRRQLKTLLAFKDLGFSLSQVARLLDEHLSNRELLDLLTGRFESLQSQIRIGQARLEQVKACLEEVENGEGRAGLVRILSIQSDQRLIGDKEKTMDIKYKHIPSMQVIGLRYQGKNEHGEIGSTWTVFNKRAHEIKNIKSGAAYGVCGIPSGLPEGEFEYICALPVEAVENVPEGMVARSLDAMKVAVFEHRGSVETLGETYTNIYQKWLPEAGLEPLKNGFDMEMYDNDFKDFSPESVMYIYVPVKE